MLGAEWLLVDERVGAREVRYGGRIQLPIWRGSSHSLTPDPTNPIPHRNHGGSPDCEAGKGGGLRGEGLGEVSNGMVLKRI